VLSLNDLARAHSDLVAEDVAWLHELTADWQMLADLSFADLVLWVPLRGRAGHVAVAQMRPTTGPTVFYDDVVGTTVARGQRLQLDQALDSGRICRERDPEWRDDLPVREETIPVVRAGQVVAVIARHTNLAAARTPSRLELTYLHSADDLSRMIAAGRFPFPGTPMVRRGAPRVGDGLVRLDRDGVVTYASPNAMSAYRRLGLTADLEGAHLGEVTAELAVPGGAVDEALHVVVSGRAPRRVDVEAGDAVVALRALPLEADGTRIGALVLVRDVTEVRRGERELLTKDATIREIHHRVKNNLQTVAALLRLQARRLDSPEARAALGQAVRRVTSIARVHETLSRDLDVSVELDAIVDDLLATVVEVAGGEVPVVAMREDHLGRVPGEVATPLALALSELVHNAVEHGLGARGGRVAVRGGRRDGSLVVEVVDDGRGLPPGFEPEAISRTSLGLQIVRTLVEHELAGTLVIGPRPDGRAGTCASVAVPLQDRTPSDD
jgi:two-component system, sensor histidine kinase PdtaS